MIKTYDIELDDALVESAEKIFETLGTDIDTAIKIFLKQAVLRKGFPFEVAIPDEDESSKNKARPDKVTISEENDDFDDLHGGITEEEEDSFGSASLKAQSRPSLSQAPEPAPVIAARVAANEALVAEMRNKIGEKDMTPEFDENEDDGTHGDYDSEPISVIKKTPQVEQKLPEPQVSEEIASDSDKDDEEDEDETTPENLFDAWNVGEEEDIGCQ